jgi:acyl carrier protein
MSSAPTTIASPRTRLESTLAAIWRDVLGVADIDVNRSFFEIEGGSSLTAVLLFARVNRELGITLSPRTLFESPSVAKLAAAIERRAPQSPPLPPITTRTLPLSPQQHEWLGPHDRAMVRVAGWNGTAAGLDPSSYVRGVIRCHRALDTSMLERACSEVVARHDGLRSRPLWDGGEARQRCDRTAMVDVDACVVSATLPMSPESLAAVWSKMLARTDEHHRGLMRVTHVRSPGGDVIAIAIPRFAGDDWSFHVIAQDVMSLLNDRSAGTRQPPSTQFTDYVLWQREWLDAAARPAIVHDYETRLRGSHTLRLPKDCERPGEASTAAFLTTWLTPEVSRRVVQRSQHESVPLFATVLAAAAMTLARWSGDEDFLVSSYLSGRRHPQTSDMVGCLACDTLLRVLVADGTAHAALLRHLVAELRAAERVEGVPFEHVRHVATEFGEVVVRPSVVIHAPPVGDENRLQRWPDVTYDIATEESLAALDGSLVMHRDLEIFVRPPDVSGRMRVVWKYAACFEAATIQSRASEMRRALEEWAS